MWTIQHPSSLIELSFETLDLEDTPQCQFDFVKIEDVGSTIRSLGKLCGTNVASNKFTGRKLRVTFKSDSSNSATGFKARWKSLRKQLDGKSNEGQGIFIFADITHYLSLAHVYWRKSRIREINGDVL